ncbi:alpha/beta hydrolase [Luteimonas sp. SJ-92]|uniref:Proline iminopeptidase n=1 Tax=Luteimonas salinisoli TaxID=2752307 RepID=A0A853JAU2_9GAMM|nr:alpha/beta hydrolase [Luteimonas salinisoli]NZA25965.1 alpha/beta hydrolase [Luteimonas salinisoli]
MSRLLHALVLASCFAALVAAPGARAAGPAAPPQDEGPNAEAKRIIGDLQRIVTPNGVQELRRVRLGGIDQWISVRGTDRDNPILLYLHGGPAAPVMPAAWAFQRPWEDYFTVVQWDQRAAGKTYLENDPEAVAPTIRIQRYVDDAIELIAHLRETYGKEKVFVLGHSWGTIVGMRTLVEKPEWLHAYIGVGQIIQPDLGETVGYEHVLARARAEGNEEAVTELEALAPYPGGDVRGGRIDRQRKWLLHYGGHSAYRDNSDYFFASQRLSPDYSEADRRAIGQGSRLTLDRILGQWNVIDFREVRKVEAPVVMFMGRHDYATPSQPVAEWLERVEAPARHAVWFEHSAHLTPLEEPGRTLVALVNEVLPLAKDENRGRGAPSGRDRRAGKIGETAP